MSDAATTDELHAALDTFLSTVYWSDEPITLEEALTEAIEDWVAMASAEFNGSEPFCVADVPDGLSAGLANLAAAVESLARRQQLQLTASAALVAATSAWMEDAD